MSLLVMVWGGNNIAIKVALDGFPPFALAGIRFLLGSVIVCIWVYWNRAPLRMEPGERKPLIQLALLCTVQIYLLNEGVHHTLAGRSTILLCTYPFFLALFAHILLPGDHITPKKTIGMVLSFLGLLVIFAESLVIGDFRYLLGDILVLANSVLLGYRLVYLKQLSQGIHPGKLLVWQAFLSIPVFFLLSLIFERNYGLRLDVPIALGILYQGVVIAGFGFIVHTQLLKRYTASHLEAFYFATPVTGVVFSNLLLGEGVTIGIIGSMILVAVGILVVNCER